MRCHRKRGRTYYPSHAVTFKVTAGRETLLRCDCHPNHRIRYEVK